jgi:hypothetical protein
MDGDALVSVISFILKVYFGWVVKKHAIFYNKYGLRYKACVLFKDSNVQIF